MAGFEYTDWVPTADAVHSRSAPASSSSDLPPVNGYLSSSSRSLAQLASTPGSEPACSSSDTDLPGCSTLCSSAAPAFDQHTLAQVRILD
ncbi:hypothetical protein PanWU01x14_087610 [Parasponia andersonii]|uniref:Uncharacterized protein n=1 Tax=Parasponia andersonii TaxID=3476 RepID=A0A2P5D8P9_PARAD|nr:hypothetical protein PanWU01x14_087610 [Parasponia andersonii]